MGTLASRLLGRDVLTLQEFANDVMSRLAWEYPEGAVTQPRPDVVVLAGADIRAVECSVQTFYRAYQRDTRTKERQITAIVEWIATVLEATRSPEQR